MYFLHLMNVDHKACHQKEKKKNSGDYTKQKWLRGRIIWKHSHMLEDGSENVKTFKAYFKTNSRINTGVRVQITVLVSNM